MKCNMMHPYFYYFLVLSFSVRLQLVNSPPKTKIESGCPRNVKATPLDDVSAIITWDMTPRLSNVLEKYKVYYKPTIHGAQEKSVSLQSKQSVVLNALSPDTKYSATVAAIKLNKILSSAPILFRTFRSACPDNIQFKELDDVSVKIFWHSPLPDVEKFIVSYKLAGLAGSSEDSNVTVLVNNIQLNKLKPGSEYAVTITSVKSKKKYVSNLTLFQTCRVTHPRDIKLQFADDESARLIWSMELPEVEKYEVAYRAEDENIKKVLVTKYKSAELNYLKPSTRYSVTIAAFRSNKNYPSAQMEFKTYKKPKLDVSVNILNPGCAQVSWTMSRIDVSKYIVSYKAIRIGGDLEFIATKSMSAMLENLKDATQYTLKVVAVLSSKKKCQSSEILFSTPSYSNYYNLHKFDDLDIKSLENFPIPNRLSQFDYSFEFNNLPGAIKQAHHKVGNSLFIGVSRQSIVKDTFDILKRYISDPGALVTKYIRVDFKDEQGIGSGLTREWYSLFSRKVFHPNFKLFKYFDEKTNLVDINPDSEIGHPNKHLLYFELLGMFTGLAIYHKTHLEVNFPITFLKTILHRPISLQDVYQSDAQFYRSLLWIKDTDQSSEQWTFIAPESTFKNIIELKKNGVNTKVNEDNKIEYIRLMINWKYFGKVKLQMGAFIRGFRAIIPLELIEMFNENELQRMISGVFRIDIKFWKSVTTYVGYEENSSQIQWFWEAVCKFSNDQKIQLLQFVTGSSRFAIDNPDVKTHFQIEHTIADTTKLPRSWVCYNKLFLPKYETQEVLQKKLSQALDFGAVFGYK